MFALNSKPFRIQIFIKHTLQSQVNTAYFMIYYLLNNMQTNLINDFLIECSLKVLFHFENSYLQMQLFLFSNYKLLFSVFNQSSVLSVCHSKIKLRYILRIENKHFIVASRQLHYVGIEGVYNRAEHSRNMLWL